MARPIGGAIAEALRSTYTSAGVTQQAIADALGVKQTTVSSWVRGVNPTPLEALPRIEAVCQVPKGTILRLAGYVDGQGPTVKEAIAADPALNAEHRRFMLRYYDFATQDSADLVK